MTRSKLFSVGGVVLFSGVLILCFSGHNPGEPVEVSGTVFLDGKPLADADIFFLSNSLPTGSENGTPYRAHGRTDDSGHYELISGAVPGNYRVVVRAQRGGQPGVIVPGLGSDGVDSAQLAAATSAAEATSARATGYRSRPRSIPNLPMQLPDAYSSAEHTVLSVGVPVDGTSDADLQLSLNRIASAS
jgi:hypothetical protein